MYIYITEIYKIFIKKLRKKKIIVLPSINNNNNNKKKENRHLHPTRKWKKISSAFFFKFFFVKMYGNRILFIFILIFWKEERRLKFSVKALFCTVEFSTKHIRLMSNVYFNKCKLHT